MEIKMRQFFNRVFGKIDVLLDRCIEKLLKIKEKRASIYITTHERPKYSADVNTISCSSPIDVSTAIVLQGPIVTTDNFTLETLRIYQKHFPLCHLIVSTWEDEKTSILKTIESLGVHVILNKPPSYAGISNINKQIVSSLAGIKLAEELSCKYVLKTRTDQRMYSPNILAYFNDILHMFPLKVSSTKQTQRLIAVGLNTFKSRMYGISDMNIFGCVDDMQILWDCPLDSRPADELQKMIDLTTSMEEFSRVNICEVYLTTNFLEKVGRKLLWTYTDSYDAIAEHFCIVDTTALDLYWPKYTRNEYRWRSYNSSRLADFDELDFKAWSRLYTGHHGSIAGQPQ